jgi:hypothetical protein
MLAGLTSDGALAALGAAAGVLVTGLGALSGVGVPAFVSFLLVILSGAALLQGWVLTSIEESIRTLEATDSDGASDYSDPFDASARSDHSDTSTPSYHSDASAPSDPSDLTEASAPSGALRAGEPETS